jgi:hypothetical protein
VELAQTLLKIEQHDLRNQGRVVGVGADDLTLVVFTLSKRVKNK